MKGGWPSLTALSDLKKKIKKHADEASSKAHALVKEVGEHEGVQEHLRKLEEKRQQALTYVDKKHNELKLSNKAYQAGLGHIQSINDKASELAAAAKSAHGELTGAAVTAVGAVEDHVEKGKKMMELHATKAKAVTACIMKCKNAGEGDSLGGGRTRRRRAGARRGGARRGGKSRKRSGKSRKRSGKSRKRSGKSRKHRGKSRKHRR